MYFKRTCSLCVCGGERSCFNRQLVRNKPENQPEAFSSISLLRDTFWQIWYFVATHTRGMKIQEQREHQCYIISTLGVPLQRDNRSMCWAALISVTVSKMESVAPGAVKYRIVPRFSRTKGLVWHSSLQFLLFKSSKFWSQCLRTNRVPFLDVCRVFYIFVTLLLRISGVS